MYSKGSTDYDLYGIKIALNDRFLVSVDNLFLVWYVEHFPHANGSSCRVLYNLTTCDFVYSVVVPTTNNISFIYNCIDVHGNNVVGFLVSNDTCSFYLMNEQIISNYSTQDNFVIAIDGQSTGVYGFADDFLFFYQLFPTISLVTWPNTLNISPRAVDIGHNDKYAVIAGYCQSSVSVAVECGFLLRLNVSSACPYVTSTFQISTVVTYSWNDPRSIRLVTNSRTYTAQFVMSVSICWQTQQVLIGVQSLNTVYLYSLNDTQTPIGVRQTGMNLMGYGKSVAWLDQTCQKAVILANAYSYSNYEWISSSVHIYDIQSDGFNDSTQPILAYPNALQTLHQSMNPSFIRLTCSPSGHLGLLDRFGNGIGILSAPPNNYANTNTRIYVTSYLPCYRGTSRNYSSIELCYPESSSASNCSTDLFCPYGSVGEVAYSAFESIEQDQDYPEAPENTVFDDILMQNIFSFNLKSVHCLIVSPTTWVFVVMIIVGIIVIGMECSERFYPHQHYIRDRAKQIFRKIDLIGEGEVWIGGLITTAIIVFIISAYVFSNAFFHQYPIEQLKDNNSFACDATLRNAKFATTTQKRWDPRRTSKESQLIFDLLDAQVFTLNIDLIQTAYTCGDYFYIQRSDGYKITLVSITNCTTNYNGTILSLAIVLPAHELTVQLVLSGLKTVGAVRIGLSSPSATLEHGRFTALEMKFASTFVSSSLDQVLTESNVFPIELTKIINETDPLDSNGSPQFSAIWSYSLTANTDQLFTSENRYTFFYRSQTNISVTISQNIFYISNIQQPIARQTEVIFRCLLFTIVVLEVFGLLFLIVKLLFIPILHMIYTRLYQNFAKIHKVYPSSDLSMVTVENKNPLDTLTHTFKTQMPRRRWSSGTHVNEMNNCSAH
ncbi:unnamed protein product [Adineta ricciae]|uniref:Uncharacterized protein n=1 Tax=Adineta ricciae TaxID=249248 RepID=A0A814FMU2_ADIRI|nr:unnamed protein product [Adineta ricciae]CAF1252278.1 unnamed protein product [Adineta ricciae]